jgi:protein-L-isoaspartate(D-aspartate) O-methyltransferase
MVRVQLAARGIRDERVLAAFAEVPRHEFVPADIRDLAYDDEALPIGSGQTISQPYMVASMVQALEPLAGDHLLEVGAGSGYAAAVCSRLVAMVVAVERLAVLAEAARRRLAALGYTNIDVIIGDGSVGMAERGPFDDILVSAGAPAVPAALVQQLAPMGRLVVPVGPLGAQELLRVRRAGEHDVRQERLGPVRFVPLVGEGGWPG